MTSDIIQNSYVVRERNRLAEKALSSKRFAGRRKKAFGVIKNDNPNKLKQETASNAANTNANVQAKSEIKEVKKEKQTFDKTALLKTAYKMLRQAERNLALKEERIQSLQEILTIDELTGLTNRRGFFHAFEAELDRTNRGENEGGLLLLVDLDYFKMINDTYGHLAGDEALRTVSNYLSSTIRPMDVAARLGGDEFIILMPNANISKAMQRARKIGNALNDLSFDWGEDTVHIHASIGLKEFVRGDTIETIIEQADRGLYEDKKQRKDQASFAAE
jgi:diguanylate cyclase (GGDEF)-like protein